MCFLEVLLSAVNLLLLKASMDMCTHGSEVHTWTLYKLDINECEAQPCDQICINTEGTFECECLGGFRLQDDSRNCIGK